MTTDVYVAGDTDELGRWKVCFAMQMQWAGPPNRWRVEFEVSRSTQRRGAFAYKYFVSCPRDKALMDVHYWESPGPNRMLWLPPATPPAVLVRSDRWGDTQQPQQTPSTSKIVPTGGCDDATTEDILLFYPVATAPYRVLAGLEHMLRRDAWASHPAV